MFVCVGFSLSFGLLASRARSRFSEGTDLCGSGGTRVPAVRFMELDLDSNWVVPIRLRVSHASFYDRPRLQKHAHGQIAGRGEQLWSNYMQHTSICVICTFAYVSVLQLCEILPLSSCQDRVCVSAHECGLALDRFCVSRDPPYPPWDVCAATPLDS